MDTFFSTIYYYTNVLYCQELDNYLYATVPGYVRVGLFMVVVSLVMTLVFYYMVKPVRHQMLIWFVCLGLNALINLIFALQYTITPLINNEIDESEEWSFGDAFGFGVANVIWSVVAVLVLSLFLKWWSPAKYVPFKKF